MGAAAKIEENVPRQRVRVTVRGAVQGVGFRPFIYRLAKDLGLQGWVNNSPAGVFIEVEGPLEKLRSFLLRIESEKPARSFIQNLESSFLDVAGFNGFEIRMSEQGGAKTAIVLPDISTCADCLREVFDAQDRRYLYPFTNCTNCGPRFSIIEGLPYDRPRTTMKKFKMCPACRAEYEDPLDRRFHAQPNACPVCGPHLELWDWDGKKLSSGNDALLAAAREIRRGRIAAVKGLGGFHLIADARRDESVNSLRLRKHREEKPFALMFPGLEAVLEVCEASAVEQRSLNSPESPIVLLKAKECQRLVSGSIAPGNPYLGVMLAYTPLHHLLMRELGFPVVATSGNLSDEPICIDENEAAERLRGIADVFLVHDRGIARHVDDSIVREMAGREMVLRRARGFAPLPVVIDQDSPPLLAVGAHLKNAVAASVGKQAFISQHIGDLETVTAFDAFRRVIESFKDLYEIEPGKIACDAHPDYLSTRFARNSGLPVIAVQHHYAHILSCMAENDLDAPALGVAWDGTGFGTDGTVWGGEFLRISEGGFERATHLRTFRLPGGEKAVKEPRRTALGILFEVFGDAVFQMDGLEPLRSFAAAELSVVQRMLNNGLNAPLTSSAGRLFDGVASIIGLRQKIGFEGQAAMELEFLIDGLQTDERYGFEIMRTEPAAIDWSLMITEIVADVRGNLPAAKISAKFHNTLVEMIVAAARAAGEKRVALSGGCFQNKYLLEHAVSRLRSEKFKVYWHQRVPTNDGGIALGQTLAAVRNQD